MRAAVAAEELASQLSVGIYPWTQEPYRIVRNHRGDLYEMLYPAGKENRMRISSSTGNSLSRYLFNEQTGAGDSV